MSIGPSDIDDYLRGARSVSIRAARQAKFAAWFQGRRWRIMTELTGQGPEGICERGEIRLKPPATFTTPLGNVGCRHGYIIQEIGPDGSDLSTRPAAFGMQTLRVAQEKYSAVVNLPPRRGRGRPRKVDKAQAG